MKDTEQEYSYSYGSTTTDEKIIPITREYIENIKIVKAEMFFYLDEADNSKDKYSLIPVLRKLKDKHDLLKHMKLILKIKVNAHEWFFKGNNQYDHGFFIQKGADGNIVSPLFRELEETDLWLYENHKTLSNDGKIVKFFVGV